jgi:hypothetical protein
MKTVRRPPMSMVLVTSSIDSRMKLESSLMIERVTPGGISFFRARTASRTPSATATVFAPDCFWISRANAGRSSRKAAFRGSSIPSTTWARSRT